MDRLYRIELEHLSFDARCLEAKRLQLPSFMIWVLPPIGNRGRKLVSLPQVRTGNRRVTFPPTAKYAKCNLKRDSPLKWQWFPFGFLHIPIKKHEANKSFVLAGTAARTAVRSYWGCTAPPSYRLVSWPLLDGWRVFCCSRAKERPTCSGPVLVTNAEAADTIHAIKLYVSACGLW